jgi:UDP-N-acetylglucosamine:LPS N-acetylglucosamine transferase
LLISCHILITLLLPQAHGKAQLVSITADPFSPHADSFSPRMDLCVVSSNAARAIALRQGILPEKIRLAAHPVLPGYLSAALGKQETLARLGLADGALTILVTGGGDGLGKMLQVIDRLDASGLPIQLVIVCGRNQKFYAELKTRKFHLPVSVIPFTEEMPSLLCAADVLVTKAGPSALFEAFQAGLPILIFDAILGQEAGNVAYVCEHGAGLFCKSPAEVVDALHSLIGDPALRQRMSACSLALARPNAALDVARACLSLLEDAQP